VVINPVSLIIHVERSVACLYSVRVV
jgi:hypothetical protein